MDGDLRGVEILELEGDDYEPRGWFTDEQLLASPLLGALEAPAGSVFPPTG